MKKLIFTMDDFGVHESVSYQIRDILRFEIQRKVDKFFEEYHEHQTQLMVVFENKALLATKRAERFEQLYTELLNKQGGTYDSGRVEGHSGGSVEAASVPDKVEDI